MIYKIHFVKSNVTLDYDSEKDKALSILDKAWDHDLFLRAGCRSGYCGTCQLKLLEGEVKYFYDPPPLAPDSGAILSCSVYPVSDVKIDC